MIAPSVAGKTGCIVKVRLAVRRYFDTSLYLVPGMGFFLMSTCARYLAAGFVLHKVLSAPTLNIYQYAFHDFSGTVYVPGVYLSTFGKMLLLAAD